jgi:hypothetical protein
MCKNTLPTSSSLRGFQQGVRLLLRSGVELENPSVALAVRADALRSVGVNTDETGCPPPTSQFFNLAPPGTRQVAVPVTRIKTFQRCAGVVPEEGVLDQDDHAFLELVTAESDVLGGGVEQVVDGNERCGDFHGTLPCWWCKPE